MAVTEDMLFNMITKAHVANSKILMTGSLAELSMKYYLKNVSDVNIMIVPSDIIAVEEFGSKQRCKQLLNKDSETKLGFVKLISRDGRIYTSYLQFGGEKVSVQQGPSNKWDFFRPGPDSLFDNISKIIPDLENFSLDRVISVKCQEWPKVANEWLIRERLNGWPLKSTIEEIANQGCHFVTKPEMDRTWRYSFSQAELTLVLTWTPNQKYVYHILRSILKDIRKNVKERYEKRQSKKVFCSYSIKTLMFWKCEDESPNFWTNVNCESSIKSLLLNFIEWLIDLKCPNFFIRNYNNWTQIQISISFKQEIEYLLTLCGDGTIKKLIVDDPFHEPAVFSISCLNSTTLQMHMKLCGYISMMNSVGLSEIFSFRQFAELINLRYLCRGLILQNQVVSTLPIKSDPQCNNHIEECLNKAFASTYQNDTDQELFPPSAKDLSAYEFLVILHKYFASIKTVPCSRELDISRRRITNFETTVLELLVSQRTNSMFEIMIKDLMICRFMPHPLYSLFAAFLANFYYVRVKDYKRAAVICEEALLRYEEAKKLYVAYYPFPLTNKLSSIFDDTIQTTIGFLTLVKSLVINARKSTSNEDPRDPKIHLRVQTFLRYIRSRLSEKGGSSLRNCSKYHLDKNLLHESLNILVEDLFSFTKSEHGELRYYTRPLNL